MLERSPLLTFIDTDQSVLTKQSCIWSYTRLTFKVSIF